VHVCSVAYHLNARKLSFSAIVCTGPKLGWYKKEFDSK
jgi:hypothetical protein